MKKFSVLQVQWKEVVRDYEVAESVRIRLHRSLSWALRMEKHEADEDGLDESFLCGWIALNALFAKWDCNQKQCRPEKESLNDFLHVIISLDRQYQLQSKLNELKWHIEQLLACPYLNGHFWQAYEGGSAPRPCLAQHKDQFDFFHKKGIDVLLMQALLRIYLMRNQLVHGGATYGSEMNRHTLMLCNSILKPLLNCFLEILIAEGSDSDLGITPYPPIR